MAGKPGRPKGSVKLTPERTDIIVEALEKGHSLTSAARMAGLHRDTLQRWMKRGRKGESPLLCHFYVTVQEALAKSEQKLVEWCSITPRRIGVLRLGYCQVEKCTLVWDIPWPQ